eukprot:15829532-Heterocapsa_arctica.AAC.1
MLHYTITYPLSLCFPPVVFVAAAAAAAAAIAVAVAVLSLFLTLTAGSKISKVQADKYACRSLSARLGMGVCLAGNEYVGLFTA